MVKPSERYPFTNIPLDERIDIIINKAFQNSTLFEGFSISELGKLLCLLVKNCHFIFSNSLYEQVDCVGMGSPLGPLFANTFFSFNELAWLTNCPSEIKPLFFRRYVDDCFVIFRSRDHVRLFEDYLNSQHPKISFTVVN